MKHGNKGAITWTWTIHELSTLLQVPGGPGLQLKPARHCRVRGGCSYIPVLGLVARVQQVYGLVGSYASTVHRLGGRWKISTCGRNGLELSELWSKFPGNRAVVCTLDHGASDYSVLCGMQTTELQTTEFETTGLRHW